jgi:quercetin dioxygenase-like cupin family protein
MEVQPRNPTARGPVDWFTGEVWIDAIAQGHGPTPLSLGAVHFTPGARTAWHSHDIGQTIHVTEGQGLVQRRGEPMFTIREGDSVFFPANEWHWHGASPDHFMTHMAVTEGNTGWGDHVTEAEYGGTR